jgi:hypothetical protein
VASKRKHSRDGELVAEVLGRTQRHLHTQPRKSVNESVLWLARRVNETERALLVLT